MPVRQTKALVAALWRFLRRFETRALLIFMAAMAALWAFFSIAEEVGEGDTHEVDERLILLFRNPNDLNDPIGSGSFEEAVRDITALGGFTIVTLTTVVGFLAFLFHRRWKHAFVLLGTVLLAFASSEGMKALYGRPRPDLVPHGSNVYSASFPSGHSTLSTATFLTLAVLIASLEESRRAKVMVYALAVLILVTVGLSRIYLGVHWPSDVVAGWCLGSAWAFLAWVVLRWIGGRTRG